MSVPSLPFIRLCSVEEVPDASLKSFTVSGEEILLARFRDQ